MSKAKLVIMAVLSGQSQSEVASRYGVSKGWVSKLMSRYRTDGEAAFEPRSRRPHSSPTAIPPATVELIIRLRKELSEQGLDAGPDTLCWHLAQHHGITVSRATVARYLTRAGLVTPEPRKRPRSSYIHFQADLPNECWQSDFIHYRLTRPDGSPGAGVEIITWLDDCTRYALSVTAHHRITAPIVLTTFRAAVAAHGPPAATLTDNGMVYTVRFAGRGRRGGRTGLETELHRLGITQKNGAPAHPQTQGKAERFQQTLKKWLAAQPDQPATIADLQSLLDRFVAYYNQQRPHRSLPHRAPPATVYTSRPKATPGDRADDTHHRVRRDRVDTAGKITLRYGGKLYSIGIGRTHARTHVIVLVQDRNIRIINAATGQLLRELTLDPTPRDPRTGRPPGPPPKPPNP